MGIFDGSRKASVSLFGVVDEFGGGVDEVVWDRRGEEGSGCLIALRLGTEDAWPCRCNIRASNGAEH